MPDLDAKHAVVQVHLDLKHQPEFYFTSTDLPVKDHTHLFFKNGKKDGFKVDFELVDPDNLYTFGTDKKKALYSTEESRCPHEEGQWEDFKALGIDKSQLVLTVHNKNQPKNGYEQDFGYTLRITQDGVNYKDLDPIGTNQNNNSINVAYSAALTFAAGGAAIGGLVAAFAMQNTTQMSVLMGAVVGAAIGLGAFFLTRGGVQRTA